MLGSIASGIMQGMTFGAGSAIAHRAVDGVMGPREMRVVHEGQQSQGAPAAAAGGLPVADAPAAPAAGAGRDCSVYQMDLNKCLAENTSQIAMCQGFVDSLSSCQKGEMF